MELIGFGENGYGWFLMRGAWVTLALAFGGYCLALVLGIAIALMTLQPGGIRWAIWRVYASIFMGVPSLLVVFLLFFGGSAIVGGILSPIGVDLSLDMTPFSAGLVGLGIVYAAYVAELVRSAIRNVPPGQFETALVLLIPRVHIWRRIIAPQAGRLALPGLVNLWIILLKDTALVSLVGLNDIIAQAKTAAGSTREPFIFYTVAAAFFVVISMVTLRFTDRLRLGLERGQRVGEP